MKLSYSKKEFEDIGEVFTTAMSKYSEHAKKSLQAANDMGSRAKNLETQLKTVRDNKKQLEDIATRSQERAGRIDALFIGAGEG